MNILFNYLPIFKYGRNTDLLYSKNFKEIEILDKNISVSFNHNFFSNLLNYFFYYLRAFVNKVYIKNIITLNKYSDQVLIFPSQIKNIDLIFSHGLFPKVISKAHKPIIYEDGFMTNEYCNVNNYEEREEEIRYKIKRYKLVDLILFNTQEAINRFCSLHPEFKNKVKYLPFFLPYIEPIDEKVFEKKFIRSDKIRLLFVGRDGRRKGVLNLVKALSLLKIKHPNSFNSLEINIITETALNLVDIPEIKYFKKLPREKILKIMSECHIFCLPTLRESYGLVLIEAMANGCAIITDNKEPRIEILDNGNAGILIDTTNVDVLLNTITQLINDKDKLTKTAANARQRFISEYSIESVYARLISYIYLLLKK